MCVPSSLEKKKTDWQTVFIENVTHELKKKKTTTTKNNKHTHTHTWQIYALLCDFLTCTIAINLFWLWPMMRLCRVTAMFIRIENGELRFCELHRISLLIIALIVWIASNGEKKIRVFDSTWKRISFYTQKCAHFHWYGGVIVATVARCSTNKLVWPFDAFIRIISFIIN